MQNRLCRNYLGEKPTYEIKSVKAGRQWNNIDVWALVNEKHFIVIEDKKERKNILTNLTDILK